MTLVTIDPNDKSKKQAVRRRGNGKTVNERVERAKRNFDVERTELEIAAERAQLTVLQEITRRKELQRARVNDLYAKQEEKRAPQRQIDQSFVLWLLIGLAALTFVTTAMLTADGTIGAAASARFAVPWFSYILFGAFEIAILAFMLMYYVLGSRVETSGKREGKPVRAGQWFFAMIVTASLTVSLSVYHVLDLYNYDFTSVDMWFGIGIRLAVAVFFVLISKGIAGVVFAKAIRL